MDGQGTIVIGLNRGNLALNLLVVCILLAFFLLPFFFQWMGTPLNVTGQASGKMWFFLIDLAVSVFLAGLAIRIARLLLRRSPALVIDARGLTINCTYHPFGLVPWSSIANIDSQRSVNSRSGQDKPRVSILLKAGKDEMATGARIEIVPSWLDIEPTILAARLHAGLAAYRNGV